jgi:hypothetical protein
MGVRGWRGAGWVVRGEKWWKSVCLRVWCGAEGAVVGVDCMGAADPFAHGGVGDDSMKGWMGSAGHG